MRAVRGAGGGVHLGRPLVSSGEGADLLLVRCRAEGLRRYAMYESQAAKGTRHKLVGVAGATVQQLVEDADPRGRGVPLDLHAPPNKGSATSWLLPSSARHQSRGTLWIERCMLLGVELEAPPKTGKGALQYD